MMEQSHQTILKNYVTNSVKKGTFKNYVTNRVKKKKEYSMKKYIYIYKITRLLHWQFEKVWKGSIAKHYVLGKVFSSTEIFIRTEQ